MKKHLRILVCGIAAGTAVIASSCAPLPMDSSQDRAYFEDEFAAPPITVSPC